jgi:hypothetical protein
LAILEDATTLDERFRLRAGFFRLRLACPCRQAETTASGSQQAECFLSEQNHAIATIFAYILKMGWVAVQNVIHTEIKIKYNSY